LEKLKYEIADVKTDEKKYFENLDKNLKSKLENLDKEQQTKKK